MSRKAAELLARAKERIADSNKWCTGYLKRDEKYCAVGALQKEALGRTVPVLGRLSPYVNTVLLYPESLNSIGLGEEVTAFDEAYKFLERAACSMEGRPIAPWSFNDSRDHPAVMEMFDTAIERACRSDSSREEL